ncbi:aminoglycoside phosphotransferase family protein [Rhodocyclus tenuis]|uniref:aminoglycoside phosphotransferase family protein n=1 Tax=Rhodocyclus tenuis TaxID=1066 RepID=UPI003B8A7EEF|nr:aminoglycoside phosphotransferase [Rhodocyclus tenuis]
MSQPTQDKAEILSANPATDVRSQTMHAWLAAQLGGEDWQIAPASADASFRRYFRVSLPDGTTRIVMDAPPPHEDCRPFLDIAALFRAAGANTPEVFAANVEDGFLLLADLGQCTYLDALRVEPAAAPVLYGEARAALIAIQRASRPSVLPAYDRELLARELALFPDWYLARHLGITLDAAQQQTLASAFATLLDCALAQPQVFVHRDYHSRNLMVSGDAFPASPGVLDFQDAVFGPASYDVVSLFRDAYIDWDEEQELDFVIRYWEEARRAGLPLPAEFHEFYRDYEWMGAQRQLKVLGIFARLNYRDGKDGYLKDMPRVAAYLRRACERYRELLPLARLLDVIENRQTVLGFHV